jgi:hypothetical protein
MCRSMAALHRVRFLGKTSNYCRMTSILLFFSCARYSLYLLIIILLSLSTVWFSSCKHHRQMNSMWRIFRLLLLSLFRETKWREYLVKHVNSLAYQLSVRFSVDRRIDATYICLNVDIGTHAITSSSRQVQQVHSEMEKKQIVLFSLLTMRVSSVRCSTDHCYHDGCQ